MARWYDPTPGAVKIGDDDRLAIMGECTGYRPVVVERHQLCRVTVQSRQETVADTRTSGSTGVAIPIGGIAVGLSGGSTSRTTFRTIEEHWVEIMWQDERNRPPYVCCIPYGRRVDAEKFVVMIERMASQPPLVDARPAESGALPTAA